MDQIPTPIQTNQASGDTVGLSTAVVTNQFLIAKYTGDGTFTPTIADTCTSTWTVRVNNFVNATTHTYVWTAPAGCSGSDTITITESGAGDPALSVLVYPSRVGFDAAATGTNSLASNALIFPNITTTKYRDIILESVTAGHSVTFGGPHDVAFTPDFVAEIASTTSHTDYFQSKLSGDPGTVTGSTVSSSQVSGSTTQIILAFTSASALTVCTPTIPDGVVSQTYSFQLQACGGAGTNVWSINSGTLPCGLSLSSGGIISGTPTCSNGNTIQFKVTDTAAATATANLTLHVGASADTITRIQGAGGQILNGVVAGDRILFGVMNTSAFASIYAQSVSLSDGLGSTYVPIPGATNDLVQLYWGIAASSGTINMSVTPSLTSGFTWISEWSPTIQMIFDTGVNSKYNSTTGSSPISSATITSPVAEMLYAFASPVTQAATVTVSAPFSRDVNASGGVNARQSESDYNVSAAAGSNTATWTTSGNTGNTFNMTLLGFRPTVSGTAPVQTAHNRSQVY